MITNYISFTDQEISGDSADKGDFTPKQEPGFVSGVICPRDYSSKMPYSLRNNVSRLIIKWESQKHNPTGSSEGAISQIDSPIMLNHNNFTQSI